MSESQAAGQTSGPRYETRDANVRAVTIFVIVLFVTIIGALGMSWGVLQYFTTRQKPATPFWSDRTLPPAPRLQVSPRADLQHYRANENEALSSYGWIDRKAGIVRIPIDQAMDLLVRRGLPVRSGATAQAALRPGTVQQYTVPKGYTPQ